MHLKQLFYILCLLVPALIMAQPGERKPIPQDTVIVNKGSLTEMTITYRGTAQKQVLRYRKGVKHGLQETYSADGKLSETMVYADGYPDGERVLYDHNGQLRERSYYKYQKKQKRSTLEGKKENYTNNILITQYTYKDSLKNGPFKTYTFKGTPLEQGTYKDNLLTGRNIHFGADGKENLVSNYAIIIDEKGKQKSILQGDWVSYAPSGKLSEKGSYNKGLKSGQWTQWDYTTGLLTAETVYKEGKKHGTYKTYRNGKLQSSGIFYEEIEVNGQKLRNVYDGRVVSYQDDGKMQSVSDYNMGKHHGISQYYAIDGNLQSERHFEGGLETGTSVYYKDGSKSLETNYAIIDKDGVKSSVKHGTETSWTKDVLTGQTTYVYGKKHGTSKSFYPNGKPEKVLNFNNGNLEGEYLYYHDNGQLYYRKTYVIRKLYDGSLKSEETGWDEVFDKDGRIQSRKFHGPKETTLISMEYVDGMPQTYEVSKRLEAAYFPDGKLMSVKIVGNNTWPLAFYFYRNGSLRKMKFDDRATLSSATAEFNDKGTVLSVYNEQDGNKEIKTDVTAYAKAANPAWSNAPLFTDIEKQGRYKLDYTNGRTFLDISYKNNLPHGNFVVYEPVRGDTIYYSHFKDGLPNGRFVEKFAGLQVVARGTYHDNGEKAENRLYKPDGKPWYYQTNDTLGHTVEDEQYYPNGRMKSRNNNADGTSAQYDEGGLMLYEYALVPGREGFKINRQYYPGTKQLKREIFYGPDGAEGTDIGYHANGKLQFKLYNKANKREGPYVLYDEKGTLLREGMYADGEMEGEWISYTDGKREVDFYEKGKRQVGPPKTSCGCADTAMASGDIKFAPSLDGLASYKSMQFYLPPYLIPVDEFNYKSIFYVGLQTSNGNDGGFSSMKLLANKPLAFYLPADKQVKITLNPCTTKGYISAIELNSNYNFNNEEQSFTSLYPKRIMLELPGSPLKSADKDYGSFTMLFDVKSVSLDRWEFKVGDAARPDACFSAGIIKGFLNVEVADAEPWLFRNTPHYNHYPEGGRQLTGQEHNKNKELDNFFGIKINKAKVSFPLTGKNGTVTVNAQANEVYAGGKFVSGSIFFECIKNSDDNSYTYNQGTTAINFTIDDIKRQWAYKGFTRLETTYEPGEMRFQLTFFAE